MKRWSGSAAAVFFLSPARAAEHYSRMIPRFIDHHQRHISGLPESLFPRE